MRNPLRPALVAICATLAAMATPPSAIPPYSVKEGLQGTLRMVGSDSIDPMVRLWSQEFQKLQPGISFSILSHGSGTAPAALIKGESELGHMSRAMTDKEAGDFQAHFGYAPTAVNVGFDALAIYVNRHNPIRQLTLAQLDAIYGATRLAGAPKALDGWWDLGLRGSKVQRYWIRPYTRDENSGSRTFFMEKVLLKGGVFKEGVRTLDQMGILEAVGRDINAIGYGPESYQNPRVRVVPLAILDAGKAFLPTLDNIQTGRYALARHLYFYVNLEPGKPLPPAVQAFLEFVLSSQGQTLAKGYGAAPLTPDLAGGELAKLR